mgnify:FL=1
MQLANIVRERWKGVLFCLIIAIPATLLGKQIEVVGGPVFAILFGMVLALVFPRKRREQLAAGVTYTSKKVLQYAVILLGFGMNSPRFCPRAPVAADYRGDDLDLACHRLCALPRHERTG